MSNNTQNVATKALLPIDDTAANPSISFGGGANIGSNSSGTGIYGDSTQVKVSVAGTDVATIDANGISGALKSPQTLDATNKVIIMVGAGAPVDGTTGDNIAGIGSLYIDRTNGALYIQTDVITSPVWVLVGPV